MQPNLRTSHMSIQGSSVSSQQYPTMIAQQHIQASLHTTLDYLNGCTIIQSLGKYGTCYLFGGCIRSKIRNENPNDIDILVVTGNAATDLNNVKDDLIHADQDVVGVYKTLDYDGIKFDKEIGIIKLMDTDDTPYDIIFAPSIDSIHIDFDVNSMAIELQSSQPSSIILLGNQASDTITNTTAIAAIYELILCKQFNVMQPTAIMTSQMYVRTCACLLKRFGKLFVNGWNLQPTSSNLKVALFILRTQRPNYSAVVDRENGVMAIAHLIMFVKTHGTFTQVKTLIDTLENSTEYYKRVIERGTRSFRLRQYNENGSELCQRLLGMFK